LLGSLYSAERKFVKGREVVFGLKGLPYGFEAALP